MNKKQKYLDSELDIETRVDYLLNRLNVDEKVRLIRGKDFWTTEAIERLKVPKFGMTDGPLGVAYHSSNKGKTTRFPATIALAATWNKELAFKMGKAMGKETKLVGRHQILAPGVNIIRSPLCGRNFEYLSEDPILSSDLGAEIIKGIQSEEIACCVKHYVTNNSETKRMSISTEIDERTLQEIYIKNFGRIIRKANPWGLMVCYNRVNGVYGAENKYLLKEILRDQLGFTGHVVSDWGAAQRTSGASACIKAGLNLEMPGSFILSRTYRKKKVKKALNEGKINEDDINHIVRPLLRTFFRVGLFEQENPNPQGNIDIPEHQQIAQQIAEEGMVLLKNQNNFLPLNLEKIKKIAILGPNASRVFGKPYYGGSSAVKPPFEITPYKGLNQYISGKAEVVSNPEDADIVLLVVGLNHGGHFLLNYLLNKEGDTEGKDRTSYKLPEEQEQLIHETLKKNPNTIVILIAGSPIDVSDWYDDVPALLNAWYPGMMGGNALARVLFGEVSPSGKLPLTYPKSLEDHPAHKSPRRFPGNLDELKIYYEEGIYVGYRYFDRNEIEPFFPFGFGLSYTEFEISSIRIDKKDIHNEDQFEVSVDVKNIGKRNGAEVIQIYIQDNESSVDRPPRELQAFEKLFLNPGEKKTVSFQLDKSSLEFYSEKEHKFKAEPGKFTIWAGTSSRELPLSIDINYKS
ncbi:MAG: glycosyl hydrolase [Promethearchaeota archaeon]|nr:MAG: glycosyl hydrolase [Candidatus Lokiarchaeota archaeon]